MIVNKIKNLETECRIDKNQLTKTKKIKKINIHRQTTKLLKLKILEKEKLAECLKQKNESVSWKIKWWK